MAADDVATAYGAVAGQYAEFVHGELERRPLDRAFLDAFADMASEVGVTGRAVDLGCGPGHITAYLRDRGLSVFGVDLAPEMIGLARRAYPDLRFDVGAMDALDIPDGDVDAIVAWYSFIHVSPPGLLAFFVEFRRVLARRGLLLLGFFESADDLVSEFDHKVVPAYRWPIGELAALARQAGLVEVARMLREPDSDERFRHGRLLLSADG